MMNFIRYIFLSFCIYIISYLIVKKQERLYYKFFYYFKAFVSIDNGAKMIIHKLNKGKFWLRIFYCKSKQGAMNRKVNHKHSRSGPSKQSDFNNKIKHGDKLLSFSIYMILYFLLEVKLKVC